MILYYTRSQKTKVFAEVLHEALGLPLHELESELNSLSDFKFMFKALGSVFTKKEQPISNMPAHIPSEIYLCGPIWGGRIAAPAQYFLNHANLSNTKVNLLLTASTPHDKYKAAALDDLAKRNCIPGEVYLFATGKELPEKDVVAQQLHEMSDGKIG